VRWNYFRAMDDLHTWLYEPSYFADSKWAGPLVGTLAAALPSEALRELKCTAFAIVKPDAVTAGKTADVIAHLRANQLEPIEAEPLWNPQVRQFEELYKFNLTVYNEQNQIGSWWLNSQVYVMGPSLLLMLRSLASPHETHRLLTALKGPSTPYLGKPGQLRYDLRACNRSLNMLHCADDPVSSAREYLIFRTPDQLVRCLQTSAQLSDEVEHANIRCRVDARIRSFERCLPPSPTKVDFFDAYARVLSILVEILQLTYGPSEDNLAALSMLSSQEQTLGLRAARLKELCGRLASGLGPDPASGLRQAELIDLLGTLLRPDQLTDVDIDNCRDVIARAGLTLPPWDELVLRTTIHYPGDLRALLQSPTIGAAGG
jgi:nucleoside diphosphate kinase